MVLFILWKFHTFHYILSRSSQTLYLPTFTFFLSLKQSKGKAKQQKHGVQFVLAHNSWVWDLPWSTANILSVTALKEMVFPSPSNISKYCSISVFLPLYIWRVSCIMKHQRIEVRVQCCFSLVNYYMVHSTKGNFKHKGVFLMLD